MKDEEVWEDEEEVSTIPDKSMFEKMGKSGYSFVTAMAELVDNSIDAINEYYKKYGMKKDPLKILIMIYKRKKHTHTESIAIYDEGIGMDYKTATKALVLGYSTKKDSLGEFGIGMKGACSSFGKTFEISTGARGGELEYGYKHDEEEWKKHPDWKEKLKKRKKESKEHGTKIEVYHIKKKIGPKRIIELKKDFSKRYQSFLKNKNVDIRINGEKLKIIEPELSWGPVKFEIKLKNGNKIYGWYGLLKEGSDTGYYGFETYKNGRMVKCYEKIGFTPHPSMRRVYGTLNLDHVPWNFNKSDFDKESEEYEEAIVALEKELIELRRLARRKSGESKLKKDVQEKKDLYLEKISDVLNKSEEFKDIRIKNQKIKKAISDLSKKIPEGIDIVDIEKREKRERKGKKTENKNERERNPKKTQKVERHYITINGKKFNFKHEFVHFETTKISKEYILKEKENLIEIYSNYDFPAYVVTSDPAFYALSHVAECIAEIIMKMKDKNFETLEECKDTIMRLACELIEQFREKY